jgi:hypothetical protein
MGLTATSLHLEPSYKCGDKEFLYAHHEIMRPVFYAFNSQLKSGLRLPFEQEATILKLKKAYFGDPVEKWYAPQGSEAEAFLQKQLLERPDKVKEQGENSFWDMEQNQNWFWQCSLFCSSEEWVTLGNTIDWAVYVVHIPTKQVWEIFLR